MTTRQAWALMAAGALLWTGAATGRALGAAAFTEAGGEAAPARLSETGLYADVATLTIDPRNRPFTPQYPLWSDGAAKLRWVRLPDGAAIDVANVDRWDFPVGTRFWKEFAFDGRKVETRMFWKAAPDRWTFASYRWNEAQTDATLAPASGLADVAEVAPGRWHSIPSHDECRACHDSGRTEVLGFNALQLSDDRDPLAPHAEPVTSEMVTLRTLVAEGRLSPGRPDFVAAPPRIEAADARERAVLGYLSTNCGSCHNRQSTIASLGLFLKFAVAGDRCTPDALATTVDRHGHWVVPTAPEGESRIVAAGRPDRSALFARASSRRPSSQMPPIGTVVADREALALVKAWIAAGPSAPRCATSAGTTHQPASGGQRPVIAGQAHRGQQRLRGVAITRLPVGRQPIPVPAARQGRELRHGHHPIEAEPMPGRPSGQILFRPEEPNGGSRVADVVPPPRRRHRDVRHGARVGVGHALAHAGAHRLVR